MKHFITQMAEDGVDIPLIHQHAEQLITLSDLERDINSCIDDHGEVLDHASETLRGIRTQLRTLESRVRDRLESMLRSSSASKMLSDTIVTIRNDRFVIPGQTGVQIQLWRNCARHLILWCDTIH
nr:hypothetical protein P5640_01615 [Bacillus subtilis]